MKELIERLEETSEQFWTPSGHQTGTLLREAAQALRDLTEPRPMSDAPKDGTWFMVPQNPMNVGVWQYPAWCLVRWWAETRADRSNAYDGWHGTDGLPVNVSDDSVWLPIPPTPEVAR